MNNIQEKGIFPGLEKGDIRAAQLRLLEDIAHPENVLEQYTFTTKYNDEPTNLEIEVANGKKFSITDAQKGLQASNRSLRSLCDALPLLSCRLEQALYENTTDYLTLACHAIAFVLYHVPGSDLANPHGFKPYEKREVAFPMHEDFDLITDSSRPFVEGGHHE